jgi:uncharacterized protein with HEPN domain
MPAKSSAPKDRLFRQEAYLRDMLDSAQHIQRYVAGVEFEAFSTDSQKKDAVSMRLSAIGEAAHHLTPETAAKLPGVPFREIRAMRNRIAHDYGHVDYSIIWNVTQEDIAPLVAALEKYFRENQNK